jgi:hypothetical protein
MELVFIVVAERMYIVPGVIGLEHGRWQIAKTYNNEFSGLTAGTTG